jgi:hypothetical protein
VRIALSNPDPPAGPVRNVIRKRIAAELVAAGILPPREK